MQPKPLKPAQPLSPARRSPISLVPTAKKTNFSTFLGIILLAGALLGAGAYVNHNALDTQQEESKNLLAEQKAEFVKNILALSDSQYQQIDHHHHHHHHDHDEGQHQHSDTGHESIPPAIDHVISVQSEALKDSPILNEAGSPPIEAFEEDERLRAFASESLSQNLSDEVETRFDEDQNKLRLQIAERNAKYLQELEQIKKQRAQSLAQNQLRAQPNANQKIKMKPSFLTPQNPNFLSYKGAITKCYIHGHDMHWINDEGWILEHVKTDALVEGNQLVARNIIKERGPKHVVILYEKGYEVYNESGKLVESKVQN
jgi:hypothetical protein